MVHPSGGFNSRTSPNSPLHTSTKKQSDGAGSAGSTGSEEEGVGRKGDTVSVLKRVLESDPLSEDPLVVSAVKEAVQHALIMLTVTTPRVTLSSMTEEEGKASMLMSLRGGVAHGGGEEGEGGMW